MTQNTNVMTTQESNVENYRPSVVLTPPVDIFENEHDVLLIADVPGINKNDLSIQLDKGVLTFTGTRHLARLGSSSDGDESEKVEYTRSFTVPQTIDQAAIQANLKNGVLELKLPKKPEAKPRQIEVKIG